MPKCKIIETPRVLPGWMCCQCNTYNGLQRHDCKHCEHDRCGVDDLDRTVEGFFGYPVEPLKQMYETKLRGWKK